MKPLNKSVITVAIFGALFAGSMNIAYAATPASDVEMATGETVETAITNLQGKTDGLSNDVAGIVFTDLPTLHQTDKGLQNQITATNKDVNDTKDAVILINNDLQGAKQLLADKAQIAQDTANANSTRITALENQPTPKDGIDGKNGIDGKDGATGAQGVQGIAGKDGADGKNGIDGKAGKDGVDGKNGVNGKDGKNGLNGKDGVNGKNGVTTTITKKEVDTKTINLVKSLNTQTTAQAKDLKAAQQVFAQAQSSSNAQFKNLKDEVDDNKKEARGGVASAVAIASMPQVEKDQAMMFSAGVGSFKNEQAISVGASFHAGEHTVIKAGISDSTNNDLAMGAGIGIGF
ncbi:YadA C-terminal domain-containing protein [Enterobacter sp. ENT02]|uniref:YadA C-terminal domain-containing protein n=1 Tax=Enterobacter sp. ENT02 TaxID=2854767 RepID=UPI001C45188E|nr:YadA C-terminal domain-containing protein [Enterobacter sp. ENT02]MBV7557283.1 YadA C-terminal domain-containing protein [Enterobacter sp. ENT02]